MNSKILSNNILFDQIDKFENFAKGRKGRDKVYRFIQYLFKYYANSKTVNIDYYTKISKLIASNRKFFRIGSFIPYIKSLILNFLDLLKLNINPLNIKYQKKLVKLIESISNLLYFWYDALIWLNFAGFIKLDNKSLITLSRYQQWAIRIICSLYFKIMKYKSNGGDH